MNVQWTDFITLLKREVVPALGCTEPMSVALAAANCSKLLGQDPDRIRVWVSGNLFKNGMGVGVPGTGMIGLPVAAAVGITGGNPDAGLEVLKTLTPAQVEAAKALLPAIKVDVKDVPDVLYAEVLAEVGGHSARVVICTDHTRIILMEKDGEVLLQQNKAPGVQIQAAPSSKPAMTLREIVDFSLQVPLAEIDFIREAATMNQALAEEGLQGYGLQIGKILTEQVERKLLSDDLMTLAMRLSSAASDARMDGAMLPAMSNSGSKQAVGPLCCQHCCHGLRCGHHLAAGWRLPADQPLHQQHDWRCLRHYLRRCRQCLLHESVHLDLGGSEILADGHQQPAYPPERGDRLR